MRTVGDSPQLLRPTDLDGLTCRQAFRILEGRTPDDLSKIPAVLAWSYGHAERLIVAIESCQDLTGKAGRDARPSVPETPGPRSCGSSPKRLGRLEGLSSGMCRRVIFSIENR